MPKQLFIFNALILALILAQVLSNESKQIAKDTKSDSGSHHDSEDDQLFEADEKNPSLHCLLFGDTACDIECYLIAQVYKTLAYGYCDEHQSCFCHAYTYAEFKFNWRAKFKSRYVYRQIINNPFSLNKIIELVGYPLRTAAETKQLIKPFISPYQYSTLETRDYSLAASFINANGQINQESIRRHIAKKFDILYDNVPEWFISIEYKDRFRAALKTASAATLYNLTFRVRQLGNKTLHDILQKHLEENKIAEPKVELYELTELDEVLDNVIMNEIMKRNDNLVGALSDLLNYYINGVRSNVWS